MDPQVNQVSVGKSEIKEHRDPKVDKENLDSKVKVEYQGELEVLDPLDLVELSENLVKPVSQVQMDHRVTQVKREIQDLPVHLDLKVIVE